MNKSNIINQINTAYDFLISNGMIPHVLISNGEKTLFPPFLNDKQAVLFNIDEEAVGKFHLDEDGFSIEMRFGGKPFTVYCPIENIILLQSKNQQVVFNIIENGVTQLVKSDTNSNKIEQTKPTYKKPEFKVIVGGGQGDGIPRAKLTLV